MKLNSKINITPKTFILESLRFLGFIAIPLILAYIFIQESLFFKDNIGFEHFNLFWIGFILGLVGLTLYGLTSRFAASHFVSLLALGLLGSFPKIILATQGPIFHDEYAHLRTALDVYENGSTGGFNSIVNAAPLFDFMHHLTAFLAGMLNMEIWTAGISLIIFVHILTPASILLLTKTLGFSTKAGVLAGLIYASNSNWMYFHSQYSYESLGLPIAILVLTVVFYLLKNWDWGTGKTKALTALVSGLMFILSHTHHLSTIFILMMLAVFVIVNWMAKSNKEHLKATAVILGVATLGSIKNILENISFLTEYILSPINNGYGQFFTLIRNIIFGGSEEATSRTLFEGTTLPVYEVIASFASVVIIGLLVLYAAVAVLPKWRQKWNYSMVNITREVAVLMIYGALYVVSVFLILTPDGAEGARRSWGYLFIGLAVIAAWAWDNHMNKMVSFQNILIFLLIPIIYVGGTAAGLNGSYRFPFNNIPEATVSDVTASSEEGKALGEWFKNNTEPDTWVLADRYSKLQIGSTGRGIVLPPYANVPYWELYFNPDNIDEGTLASIAVSVYASNVKYMVVDSRMTNHMPELGFWFSRTESDIFRNDADFYVTEQELEAINDIFFLQYKTQVGPYIIYDVIFPESFTEKMPEFPEPIISTPKDVFNFLEEASRARVDITLSDIKE
jgi:hypothetical protein